MPGSRRSSAISIATASTIRRSRRSSRAARSARFTRVYGTATGWAAHMLSHLVDYTSWFNDYEPAEWVMGQAAGRGKLADVHTSPDYVAGVVHFRNGVRGVYDCGAGAPDVPEVPYWWRKCRIGALGTDGYAEVHTGGGWRAVTRTRASSPVRAAWTTTTTWRLYIQEMADWLDDDASRIRCASSTRTTEWRSSPGCIARPSKGARSRCRLTSGMDEIEGLKAKVPERKVIMTLAESAKEYKG